MPKIRDQQDFSKMDMFFQKWISFGLGAVRSRRAIFAANRYALREAVGCYQPRRLPALDHQNDSISDNVREAVMRCDGRLEDWTAQHSIYRIAGSLLCAYSDGPLATSGPAQEADIATITAQVR